MKREGRQHGMVRTHQVIPSPWNPRPDTRIPNKLNSPPTSGLFTKVPTKPTNHSKFTGKCGRPRCVECHLHPACKSKDKTKGTQKMNKSRDLVSNYKMITWRVVDGRPGLNFSGLSATGILDHLGSDYDYAHDEVDDGPDDDVYEYDGSYNQHEHDEDLMGEFWSQTERNEIVEVAEGDHDHDDDENENEIEIEGHDVMSFYDVAFVFDPIEEGDEGWCVVGEI